MEFEFLSFFVDIMPSRRGRDRPHRVPIDEKAALAPHASPPQGDPLVPSKFSVPSMPQARLFPSMTPNAFQAFTIYWYALAQAKARAQTQVGQC